MNHVNLNQATMMRATSTVGLGALGVALKPSQPSPVLESLEDQGARVKLLLDAISELIDPLLVVMGHDPRNQPVAENDAGIQSPISCALESLIIANSREISRATVSLREIRRLICL